MKIVIVDTGIGNLRSVERALEAAAAGLRTRSPSVSRSSDPDGVRQASCIVVPGQGGFREAARCFSGELGEALRERLRAGVPYLGICLGLQLLFDSSEEAPEATGLGWFRGSVRRLRGGPGVKIPHMGWNRVEPVLADLPLLRATELEPWFYFVHSYQACPVDASLVQATAGYGADRVTALVARDNVVATQFHPEKSQARGLLFLRNFLETI